MKSQKIIPVVLFIDLWFARVIPSQAMEPLETSICDLRVHLKGKELTYKKKSEPFVMGTSKLKYTLCYKPASRKPLLPSKSSPADALPLIPFVRQEENSLLAKVLESEPPLTNQSSSSLPETRFQVTDPSQWPHCVHGHLMMKFGTKLHVGSGILVGPNHVLTAGHNLYDQNQWATEVWFSPGRKGKDFPVGCIKGAILLCHPEWTKKPISRQKDNYDLGMVILEEAVGNCVGWSGLLCAPSVYFEHLDITVTGYPGEKGSKDYYSTEMWEKAARAKENWFVNAINTVKETIEYEIPTSAGQSGGAIWRQWPSWENGEDNNIFTIGIHTQGGGGKRNQGVRLTAEKFDRVISWIENYHLPDAIPYSLTEPSLAVPSSLREESGLNATQLSASDWWNKGKSYEHERQFPEAFYCFYRALEMTKGEIPDYYVLTSLGDCYWEGQGTKPNYLAAFNLYMQTENPKESPHLSYRIGKCYLRGLGVPQDIIAGLSFLEHAADLKDIDAIHELYYFYSEEYSSKGEPQVSDLSQLKKYSNLAESLGKPIPINLSHHKANRTKLVWKKVNNPGSLPGNIPSKPTYFRESFPKGSNKSYLELIWEKLNKSNKVVLCGMGGVGKTSLALEYTYKAYTGAAYSFIYWVDSETEEKLLSGYKQILKRLGRSSELGREELYQEVKEWLPQLTERWLLVFDNAAPPPFLEDKVPQLGGHILITSRYSKEWKADTINCNAFQPAEAINYLLDRLQLESNKSNNRSAYKLAQELGYHPLALSHAAAYIDFLKDSEYSMEQYLEECQNNPNLVFGDNLYHAPADQDPEICYKYLVAKTWQMAAGKLTEREKKLISYFSYLDSNFILVDDFKKPDEKPNLYNYTLSNLQSYSMIELKKPFASIHRLVQLVIQAEQESREKDSTRPESSEVKHGSLIVKELCDILIRRASSIFSENLSKNEGCEEDLRYFPHILTVLGHAKRLEIISDQINLLRWMARVLLFISLEESLETGRVSLESLLEGSENIEDEANLSSLLGRAKLLLGKGEEQSELLAFLNLQEISLSCHPRVQAAIAVFFDLGIYTTENLDEAFRWYTKAAEGGDAGAQHNLGVMYWKGRGTSQNEGLALHYFTQAADRGNIEAQRLLGTLHMNGMAGLKQDPAKAYQYFEKLAQQNDRIGQVRLGTFYKEGWGVKQDIRKAEKWIRESADHGNDVGKYCLGLLYRDGEGVSQSDEQALKLFIEAAEKGNEDAHYTLGWMYENGHGVAKNPEKAEEWYRKAEDGCPGYAIYSIGRIYEHGLSIDQDIDKAIKWYEKAIGEEYAEDVYYALIKETVNEKNLKNSC